LNARWAWCPGNFTRRPIYAPALVGWLGERPGVRASISAGPPVGWFPLAPREHFVPGYTHNANYIRRLNQITSNASIDNPPGRYINKLPGATFVSHQAFVNARPIQSNAIRIDPLQASSYPVITAPELPAHEFGARRSRSPNSAPSRINSTGFPLAATVVAPTAAPTAIPSYRRQFPAPQSTAPQSPRELSGASAQAPHDSSRRPPAAPVIVNSASPPQQPTPVPNNGYPPSPLPPNERTTIPRDNPRPRLRSAEPETSQPARLPAINEVRSAGRSQPPVHPQDAARPPMANRSVEGKPSHPGPAPAPVVPAATAAPTTPPAAPAAAPAPTRPVPQHKSEFREGERR
jgi:hypothetical protein